MPVWLRKFTFNKLKEHYEKQAEENDKIQSELKNKSKGNISQPNIKQPSTPTYKVKAPKK
jgi:hypothetical protein